MRKVILAFLLLFGSISIFGQSIRRNVLDSDISGTYRNAVKNSFRQELDRAYSLHTGYHGEVNFGYSIGLSKSDISRYEINTTHGYQFNPYLFVGAGIGLHAADGFADVPLYAAARATFVDGSITPFVDGKVGCYVTHGAGVYASVSVGCRFATWYKQGINLSVGYSREFSSNNVSLGIGYEF